MVEWTAKLWLLQPLFLGVLAVLLVLMLTLALRVLRRRRRKVCLTLRDPLRAHCWQAAEFLDKPTYCNSCTQMCFTGSSCVSCGLCTCVQSDCIKLASNSKICKPLATVTGALPSSQTQHFWVKGNLPLCSLCFKCLTPCGNLPKLADFRCVWCQQTAHEDCVEEMDVEAGACTLGPHHSSIIPPNSVTLKLEGWRGRRRCVLYVDPKLCVCACARVCVCVCGGGGGGSVAGGVARMLEKRSKDTMLLTTPIFVKLLSIDL